MSAETMNAAVAGWPRLLLRVEGLMLLVAGALLYSKLGAPWWLFAVAFIAPDLSFLGYLGGSRIGAIVYNCAHTIAVPLALALAGFLLPAFDLIAVALGWIAHIGFDRMLGFGLKYGAGFGFTHLGRIGSMSSERA